MDGLVGVGILATTETDKDLDCILYCCLVGVLAAPHHSDTAADGSQQPEQLPGQPDQGDGGGGLVGVRADDQECGGVGQWPVRVPGVGEEPHHQQQEDQPQCYR